MSVIYVPNGPVTTFREWSHKMPRRGSGVQVEVAPLGSHEEEVRPEALKPSGISFDPEFGRRENIPKKAAGFPVFLELVMELPEMSLSGATEVGQDVLHRPNVDSAMRHPRE